MTRAKVGVLEQQQEETQKPAPASSAPAPSSPTLLPLPERKYFKIGEVAELVGVEPHVLRYWETQFSQLRPHKARSGHRLYRRREVETLLVIKDLLHIQRFTIAGARQALRQQGTLSLLPRAAESVVVARSEAQIARSARSQIPVVVEEQVEEEEADDAIDDEEVELHLADPVHHTQVEIEARDGEDLEDALAEQLTAQKARRGVARVTVQARAATSSRAAKQLLLDAAKDLEAVLAKLRAR